MNEIDADKKQSADDFNNIVKPVIEKYCDAKIIHLEKLQGKLPLMLDHYFSTDALYIKDGKMFGVSSRIQRGKNYYGFSSRAERDSKTKTELQKHSDAIANDDYLPEITLQAYIVGDDLTIGMARTVDVVDYITKYKPRPIHTGKAEVGQATFYPVSWQDFQSKGYRLKIIHENKKSAITTVEKYDCKNEIAADYPPCYNLLEDKIT